MGHNVTENFQLEYERYMTAVCITSPGPVECRLRKSEHFNWFLHDFVGYGILICVDFGGIA